MARTPRATSTTFNSKQIAKRIMGNVVFPAFIKNATQKVWDLEEPLDAAVSEFFRNLASFMGTTEGLSSLDVPGLLPWKPLSLNYVKRKHSDAFWLYTLSVGNSRVLDNQIRAKMKSFRTKKAQANEFVRKQKEAVSATLISKFMGIDGLKAFGGCEIMVKDDSAEMAGHYFTNYMNLVNVKGSQYAGAYKRRAQILGDHAEYKGDDDELSAMQMKFTIRLWTNFDSADLPKIEDHLLAASIITQDDYDKLMGKASYRRPLIRPFMAYYSRILIPKIISETLDTVFKTGPGSDAEIGFTPQTKSVRRRGFTESEMKAGVTFKIGNSKPKRSK